MTPNSKPPREAIDALVASFARGEFSEVERAARGLLGRFPAHGFLWKALGSALTKLGDLASAKAAFQNAFRFAQNDAEVAKNLGVVHMHLSEFDEAASVFTAALRIAPNSPDVLRSLGAAELARNDFARAEAAFLQALAANPNDHEALSNLGVVQLQRGNIRAARELITRALSIAPSHMLGWSAVLCATCYDATATADDYFALATQWHAAVTSPSLRIGSTVSTHRRTCARADRAMRIGFVSADFKNHPVGYFLRTFLRALSNASVITYAYSNSSTNDLTTEALRTAFTHWRDIAQLSDDAVAAKIQADEIDLLVDLSGHTNGHRQTLFARRPTPRSASWLGYFASTGNPGIDFLIADSVSIPAGEERLYTEHVLRLPHARFCFSPIDDAPEVAPLPALSGNALTFGCVQNPSKLNEQTLSLWGRVHKQIPGSRVVFSNAAYKNAQVSSDLQRKLAAVGIALERVSIEHGAEYRDYLAGYAAIDFILDTSPFTGGTTTCEALWMGVPTLTLSGHTMIGRQGEALLRAVELDDWIARSEDEFVQKALDFSTDLRALDELRRSLRHRMLSSPLCDAKRFAHDWLNLVTAAMEDQT